jgi:putative glutamine amidotransferase
MAPHQRHPRPVIGVTGPDRHGAGAWWFTWLGVRLAGGRARRITPGRPATAADLDGLIVGGGADVAPDLYGEEPLSFEEIRAHMRSPRRTVVERLLGLLLSPLILLVRRLVGRKGVKGRGDAGRDDLETGLLAEAVERGLPVLGICRGAQLLNVHLGGSLHQTLADFYEEAPQVRSVLPAKPVTIEEGTRLAAILGAGTCWVNALHDQAIDETGEGLRVVARERTGVVQAIEATGGPLRIGVQWHPEYLPWVRRQRRLLRAFVEACAAPQGGDGLS